MAQRQWWGAALVATGLVVFGVAALGGTAPRAHAAEGTVAITSTAIDKTSTWAGDTVVVSFSYACNGAGGDQCTGVTATIPGVFGTDVFGAPFGPLPAISATTTTHLDSWWTTGGGDVVFSASNPLPAGATGNVTVTYRTFGTSVPDGTVHTFTPQISSTANTASGTPRSVELQAAWSWYAYHGFHFGWSYPAPTTTWASTGARTTATDPMTDRSTCPAPTSRWSSTTPTWSWSHQAEEPG